MFLLFVVVLLCCGLALSLAAPPLVGCCGRGNYMHKLAKWISLCFLSVRPSVLTVVRLMASTRFAALLIYLFLSLYFCIYFTVISRIDTHTYTHAHTQWGYRGYTLYVCVLPNQPVLINSPLNRTAQLQLLLHYQATFGRSLSLTHTD